MFLFDYCVQDYQIDEFSQEYITLHPMATQKQSSLVEEHFEPVMEVDKDQSLSDSDVSAASQSSDDELGKEKINKKSRAPR